MGMPISHKMMDRITRTSVTAARRKNELAACRFLGGQATAAASPAVSMSARRPR